MSKPQDFSHRDNLGFMILAQNEVELISFLERYMNLTGDIQSCAIIGVMLLSLRMVKDDKKINAWYHEYQDFLNKKDQYGHRAKMDKNRYELVSETKKNRTYGTIYISCKRCNKNLSNKSLIQAIKPGNKGFDFLRKNKNKKILTVCPNCFEAISNCSICRNSLGIMNPYDAVNSKARTGIRGKRAKTFTKNKEVISDWKE